MTSQATPVEQEVEVETVNCWEWMADYLSDAWDYISDACRTAYGWTRDRCNSCCCKSSESTSTLPKVERPAKTKKGILKSKKSVNQQQQHPSNLQQVAVVTEHNAPTSPQLNTTTLSQQSPPSPQPSPLQQIKSFSKETTVRSSLDDRSQTSTGSQGQRPYPDYQEISPPKPPKIDFVETGSIFGDRKRPGIDPAMFQLENGRFRSPGLSKVIPGPHGRAIRVTFQTGFPSIKSIESHRSLTVLSKTGTRKSLDGTASNSPKEEKGSFDEKEVKLKNFKSTKSYKSTSSHESKDGELINAPKSLGSLVNKQ